MFRFAPLSIVFAIIGLQNIQADTAVPSAKKALDSLPIAFEANAGRWKPDVKFTARAGAYRVLLSERGVVFQDSRHQFSVSPLNASAGAKLAGDSPLTFRTNYFLGQRKEDWRSGGVNYARVRYAGVYPGIDLLYYGAHSELEYDFIVQPGADLSRIRLQFKGVNHLSVDAGGDLVVETAGGRLVHRRPVVYQDRPGEGRREIRGRFTLLSSRVVGFAVEPYDRSLALTIDPVLSYSSLLGTSGQDRVVAAKVDKAGFVYVAGFAGSSDLHVTDSAAQTSTGGGGDIFVAKIDPNGSGAGSLLYLTYIGGGGADIPTAMALDGRFVYLTGSTTSLNFPLAGGGPQNNLLGDGTTTDAFAIKLDPSLSGFDALYYSTYLGGALADSGAGIEADSNGAMYIVGTTKSEDFPVTASAFQSAKWGNGDAFVMKIDPAASPSVVYSSYLGGEAVDEGRAIVRSASGAIYVAGFTWSATAANADRGDGRGNGDIFLVQMDLTKSGGDSVVRSAYLGGSSIDDVSKIALDSAGRVLLTGYTLSTDFPVTPDALQSQMAGIANAFVSRIDLNASGAAVLSYSTYFGGSNGDVAYDIATDAGGSVYLTGYTVSTDFPITSDALQVDAGGGIDIFISKLKLADSTGPSALLYSTYLGKAGVHVGYALAVATDGTIFVGGQTGGKNIAATDQSFQPNFAGGVSDGFILVLAPK